MHLAALWSRWIMLASKVWPCTESKSLSLDFYSTPLFFYFSCLILFSFAGHLHTGFIKNCSSRRIVKSNRRIFWKSKALSPFCGNSLKTSLEILCIKPCWDGFSYCLIAKFISHSCGTKNAAYIYLYLVSKHFFFELTGILVNYDQLLTLLHPPRVVTCGSILLNTKHSIRVKIK